MLKGKNLILKINTSETSTENWVAIAACKECSLQTDLELQEIASITSGTAREYVPKRTGWTISFSGLIPNAGLDGIKVTSDDTLIDAVRNRTLIEIQFTDGLTTDGSLYYGSAYLTSCEVGGNVGNVATYRGTLQGSGSLNKDEPEEDDE